MARIIPSFDIDNAIALYNSGVRIQDIANSIGCSESYVFKRFAAVGVSMRGIRVPLTTEAVAADYGTGNISIKQLARKYGVCRDVIYRRLKEAGITPRNRSESMYLRMSQTPLEERIKLAAHANDTVRNMPAEFHKGNAIKQAISKQRNLSKIGILEETFIKALDEVGMNPVWQQACGPYNIDIACGNIAIEIHNSPRHPHTYPFYVKRIEYLLKRGWTVVYIKFGQGVTIDETTLNKIVTVCKAASFYPAECAEYWMVRGTGEFLAAGCLNGDNLTMIPVAQSVFYNLWGYIS